MLRLLKDKNYSAAALSHLMVDTLNGQRGILFTYICVSLGLSNAVLGTATTLFQVMGAISQPFFGHLADRIGPRWLITAGVFWMAGFFSAAMFIGGWPALILLIIGSMGSGAFHPSGTMQATLSAKRLVAGEEVSAASLFFFFGQTGYLIGPLAGGPLLDHFGMHGILFFMIPAAVVIMFSIFSYWKIIYQPPARHAAKEMKPLFNPVFSAGGILSLLGVATCQAWAQQNVLTFIPKYLSDLGQPAAVYGLVSAQFMGGSAVGNITGGNLADRLGEKKVILSGLSLASVPFLLIPMVGLSPWLYLLVPLAGLFNGAAYSVIVVVAQRLIPGGVGLASGLTLGFTFSSGALGILVSGLIADHMGVTFILFLTASIALAGGIIAAGLQTGKVRPKPVQAEQSA